MALCGVPMSMIKELTLEEARRLIGEGGTARAYLQTHSDDGGATLSGIIVMSGLGAHNEDFRCDPLTAPLGLSRVNDEFWAILTLQGNTLHIKIDPEPVHRLGTNSASHTF